MLASRWRSVVAARRRDNSSSDTLGETAHRAEAIECAMSRRQFSAMRYRARASDRTGSLRAATIAGDQVSSSRRLNWHSASWLRVTISSRLRNTALAPLVEQRAIAAILGALDDKIDLNRRMNETLEAMARAIFKDWFVDFGPTRAKMEGRAPYLAPEIWSLFPDRLDDEGKPEGGRAARSVRYVERQSRERISPKHVHVRTGAYRGPVDTMGADRSRLTITRRK